MLAHKLSVQHTVSELDTFFSTEGVVSNFDESSYCLDRLFEWLYLADQYHLPMLSLEGYTVLAENFEYVTEKHNGQMQKLSSEFLTKVMETAAKHMKNLASQ